VSASELYKGTVGCDSPPIIFLKHSMRLLILFTGGGIAGMASPVWHSGAPLAMQRHKSPSLVLQRFLPVDVR
jgi:hypothetical protein